MASGLASEGGVRVVTRHRSWAWTLPALVLALLFGLVRPAPAAAHPELNRAIRLSAELDFDKALRAFERALASGTLTRDELIQLLSERALLLHALRRKDDVVSDFEWLAALEPNHRLDERAPPDLTRVWEQVRAREPAATHVELALTNDGERTQLAANVRGRHPEGLDVRAYYRKPGESGYTAQSALVPIELSLFRGSTLEAYAELRGPGQVLIGGQGSADEPVQLSLTSSTAMSLVGYTDATHQDHPRRKKWIWIGSIAAVVVVGVVTGVIIANAGDDAHKTKLMPVANF